MFHISDAHILTTFKLHTVTSQVK